MKKLVVLTALLLSAALAGCASSIHLANGPQTPAADGNVTTADGDNGNLKLDITVLHLAAPSKVSPDATVYVVWIVPAEGPPQNAGALKVGDDLKGELNTLTTQRQFDLWITAEVDPATQKPDGVRVLSGKVSR